MKKYYVYYNDDFYEMGGVDLEEFDNKKDAIKFILERYDRKDPEDRNINNYFVIYGENLKIDVLDRVVDIDLKEDKK